MSASPASAPQAASPETVPGVNEPLSPPDGFLVGHWTDPEGATGCSVVVAPPGCRGGVDVRGGGPGTRETDVISPLAGANEALSRLRNGEAAGRIVLTP